MRLLIISATSHYMDRGIVAGWGPTIEEIDHLSELFDEVKHIAILHEQCAPASSVGYRNPRVQFLGVPASGGTTLWAKLDVLRMFPRYFQEIRKHLTWADAVHVRCPANISLLACLILCAARRPKTRWIKYAGNWRPTGHEPWSYRLQRWILRSALRGAKVTVNGEWPGDPAHVHAFFNPSMTASELLSAEKLAAGKRLAEPIRLVFTGRVETAKGVGRILEIMKELRVRGVEAHADMIGDGPERRLFEQRAAQIGLAGRVAFHGWMPRGRIGAFLARAHFILLPSSASEGWPKVLSEAMAYGAVPLASTVSSIPQYLARFGAGRAIPYGDTGGYARAILEYKADPGLWSAESANACRAASYFGYEYYQRRVRELLELPALPDGMESRRPAFKDA
jgi:glycosyltransferase involved in cell wall biosynthesis